MDINKRRGADFTSSKNRSHIHVSHTIIEINKLQEIRDMALHNAIKYKWDPVLSSTHEQYLNLLNNLLKHQENL